MKREFFFKRSDGLTLIEVLISITILAILSTSLMGFFNQAYDFTKKNQNKTVGINVARNVLNFMEQQEWIKKEYLKSTEPNGHDLLPKVFTIDDCSEFVGSVDRCKGILKTKINNVEYEATVTISKNSDLQLNSFLLPVDVKVTWNNNETEVQGAIKK